MKSKVRVAVISSLVTLAVCAVAFVCIMLSWFGGVPGVWTTDLATKLSMIRYYIEQSAITEFDDESAEENMMRYYVAGGLSDDLYANYYTSEEYEEITSQNAGNFAGFGLQFFNDGESEKGLFVYRVIGGSPASAAGMKAGDRIIAVNGEDLCTLSYSDAFLAISEKKDIPVTLTVDRDGEITEFSMTATDFAKEVVSYQVKDEIGYICIYNFTASAATQFADALDKVLEQNVKGIIFDVRNNPGGMLSSVCSILDLLVPKEEVIVYTQYKNTETSYTSTVDAVTDLPMVVLINGSSASASELFASCLRDVNGALLVGTQSYGKGVGQTTRLLPDGSAVKMTTFKYFTKARNDYDGIGLVPDVVSELPAEKEKYAYTLTWDTDEQLQDAKNTILNMIKGN